LKPANLREDVRLVHPHHSNELKQGGKQKAEPDWDQRIEEAIERLREDVETSDITLPHVI
jgi:hypothetical protein